MSIAKTRIDCINAIALSILQKDTAITECGHGPPIGHGKFYPLLYNTARLFKPKVMVEIGVFHGRSTWYLALGNPAGHLYAIDKTFDVIAPSVKKLPNVTFIESDSFDCADDVPPADLIFFDSLHTYNQIRTEYHIYKTNNNAILFFDDIAPDGSDPRNDRFGMSVFWNEITQPKATLSDMHNAHGFGVIIAEELDD